MIHGILASRPWEDVALASLPGGQVGFGHRPLVQDLTSADIDATASLHNPLCAKVLGASELSSSLQGFLPFFFFFFSFFDLLLPPLDFRLDFLEDLVLLSLSVLSCHMPGELMHEPLQQLQFKLPTAKVLQGITATTTSRVASDLQVA